MSTNARLTQAVCVVLATALSSPLAFADKPGSSDVVVMTNPEVSYGAGASTIPVHGMRKGQPDGPKNDKPLRLLTPGGNAGRPGGGGGGGSSDPVVQSSAFTAGAQVTAGPNFEGLGNGFPNFSVNSAPPDTNGAVGATQYVQWVNESFAVFDKAGVTLAGPIAGNQLFQALGASHPCAVNNDGDPIAQYDKANNRWILTQFSVTNGSTLGYWQCIAVSQTSDATGAFNVYAFRQPSFNDYPKVGVWNGTYFITYNMFSGNSFAGARLCAYDGAAMRTGRTAAEQCFQLSTSFGGVLPADVDGTNAPPAGSDEYLLNFGSSSLNTWRFHADFAASGNSTLTGPITTTVANFSEACGGGTCIPQPGTRQQLDSLGDRLMYRLSYRHYADGHEALYVNHSVNPGSVAGGVRWYELYPASGGGVTVNQRSTYAISDGLSRWMASIASDKHGDIAVGYSTSSGSAYPSISFSYRAPGDALNVLGSEQQVFAGAGSQLRSLNRWGDYSAMTVDPVDDCTFWYTNEYLAASGTFNWHTRIMSFKIAGCQ